MDQAVIRMQPIRRTSDGAEGTRKIFADRSHVDEFPDPAPPKKKVLASTVKNDDASAFQYPGGKGSTGAYQAIINLMPKHKVYIEPFLGGGAILRYKKPAAVSYGVEVYKIAFENWFGFKWQDLDGFIDRGDDARRPQIIFDKDPAAKLRISNSSFFDWLSWSGVHVDNADTLIYCDPPYIRESRSTKAKIYKLEFATVEEHRHLLQRLLSFQKARVLISCYDHPLYDEMLSGWRKSHFQGLTRRGPRTETVWMNYPEPAELHDYRYLGKDYREREYIKRQKLRWIKKLSEMDQLRRYALRSAIEEFFEGGHGDKLQ